MSAGLERALSKPCAIRIDCLFIFSRWVVLLFVVELIKQYSVYSHRIALGNTTFPYANKCLVKFFIRPASQYFFNKGDILAFRKNESELFIGCSKDVIDRVVGTIDNLDIFHAL